MIGKGIEWMVVANLDVVGGLRSRDKFDAPGRKRNKAACGFHAASSSMPRERGETRRRVGSMPPRLR